MHHSFGAIVLLLTVVIAGCAGPTSERAPGSSGGGVSGDWSGPAMGSWPTQVALTLRQDGDRVGGNYQAGSSPTYPLEGTIAGQAVSLKMVGSTGYLNLRLSDDGTNLKGDGMGITGTKLDSINLTKRR